MRTSTVLVVTAALATAIALTPTETASGGLRSPVTGGLVWSKEASVTDHAPGVRCSDPTWSRLPDGITVAGRPDRQTAYLVVDGLPAGVDHEGAEEAVIAALRTWNDGINDCGLTDRSTFEFRYLGGSGGHHQPGFDGYNTVVFADGVCHSVTHVACVWVETDPETGELVGWDIVLERRFPWGTLPGPWLDMQAIVTHEIGHVVGLADQGRTPVPCDPKRATLTMFSCTWPGDIIKRTLALGDALGVEAMSDG